MEIDRGVGNVRVAEQELQCAEVGAGFMRVRRVRMPQRVGRDDLVEAGRACGVVDRRPDHFGRDRFVGPPPPHGAGKEIGLRPHPAVVLPQRGEKRGAQEEIAIAPAFALLDAQDHALAVDVADLHVAHFAPPEARAVEREQQRPVIKVLRTRDHALHFLLTEDDGQPLGALRIRELLLHVPPLQHAEVEEAQRRDLVHDRANSQFALVKQIDLVAAEIVGVDLVEGAAGVAVEAVDDAEITLACRRGVVAADELVVQALQ